MIRAAVTGWLFVVAIIAGWDAASLAVRPETFAAYRLVFDLAQETTVVAVLAVVSVCALTVALCRIAGRELPAVVVSALLCAYAAVTFTFGVAIFDFAGVPGGTGALKWIGYGFASFGAAALNELHERRPDILVNAILDAIEEAGMRIVADRGGIDTAAAASIASGAALGIVVLGVSETIILAGIGVLTVSVPAYFSYRASRSSAKRDDQKLLTDVVTKAQARARQADEDRAKNRADLLRLERKFDMMRSVNRSLVLVVEELAPDHPVLHEATRVLDEIAGIEEEAQ